MTGKRIKQGHGAKVADFQVGDVLVDASDNPVEGVVILNRGYASMSSSGSIMVRKQDPLSPDGKMLDDVYLGFQEIDEIGKLISQSFKEGMGDLVREVFSVGYNGALEEVFALEFGKAKIQNEYDAIPDSILYAANEYVRSGQYPGSFLEAVICGDLFEAVNRGDTECQKALSVIVKYVYNRFPMSCRGKENMKAWCRNGGAKWLGKDAEYVLEKLHEPSDK